MRNEIGLFLAAAMVLEGCSNTNVSVQKPIVDCQANPLASASQIYPLVEGKTIGVGGIARNGSKELVDVTLNNDGSASFAPEDKSLTLSLKDSGNGVVFDHKDLKIDFTFPDPSQRAVEVQVACADALPNIPTAPQNPQS